MKVLKSGIHKDEPLAAGMHIGIKCDPALGWHYESECQPAPKPKPSRHCSTCSCGEGLKV